MGWSIYPPIRTAWGSAKRSSTIESVFQSLPWLRLSSSNRLDLMAHLPSRKSRRLQPGGVDQVFSEEVEGYSQGTCVLFPLCQLPLTSAIL